MRGWREDGRRGHRRSDHRRSEDSRRRHRRRRPTRRGFDRCRRKSRGNGRCHDRGRRGQLAHGRRNIRPRRQLGDQGFDLRPSSARGPAQHVPMILGSQVRSQQADGREGHVPRDEGIEDRRKTPAGARHRNPCTRRVFGQSQGARAVVEEGAVAQRGVHRIRPVYHGEFACSRRTLAHRRNVGGVALGARWLPRCAMRSQRRTGLIAITQVGGLRRNARCARKCGSETRAKRRYIFAWASSGNAREATHSIHQ